MKPESWSLIRSAFGWSAVLLLVAASVLWPMMGLDGLMGLGIGFAVSGFGVLTFGMLARFASEGKKAGAWAVVFLMIKLPLIAFGTFLATAIGNAGVAGFAIGMGTVYGPLMVCAYLNASREP